MKNAFWHCEHEGKVQHHQEEEVMEFIKGLGIGNKTKFWLLSTCASKGVGGFESSYGAYCITLE
jgi:hypothetical protein